jgi:hypothetical protein
MAAEISARFKEADVLVTKGEARSFAAWKTVWDEAGRVRNAPNELPESAAAKAGKQNP